MYPLNPETLIYGAGAIGFAWLILPKLNHFMEFKVITSVVKAATGHTDMRPRAVRCRRSLNAAYDSVKKALASRAADQRWNVRKIVFQEPIEKAIRLEGLAVCQETPYQEMQRHKRKKVDTVVRIQVDITPEGEGSKVSWKYLPENVSQLQDKLQVFDPETTMLLARTNFNIVKELGLS